jgi:gamma-glutamylcyclotransferase (GGCT)/AIG2-like uncharacterized protein YtfP
MNNNNNNNVATMPATYDESDFTPPMGVNVLVFVYGSLRAGMGNHGLLSGGVFAGPGTLTPSAGQAFEMLSLGAFPALVATTPDLATTITGEVYRVDASIMRRLDALEGVRPDGTGLYYKRRVALDDGTVVIAYIMKRPQRALPVVKSGDWCAYKRNPNAQISSIARWARKNSS